MTQRNPMQGQSLEKNSPPVEKLLKPVEISDNSMLANLKSAGGIMFFYPGSPMWRRSGIHQTHKDKKASEYQEGLGWAAAAAARANGNDWCRHYIPMRGPIILGAAIFRKALTTNKPDLDNYVKLIQDSLTMARIYCDDAQVVEYFPGTRKVDSPTEGVRIIVAPNTGATRIILETVHEL